MVRVIPVHSFLEQKVARIEEPTASCTAGDFLLLALPTHSVEVRDLTTPDLGPVTTFPTVDLVLQMIHCDRGNYVATLETRAKKNISCVRVYVNWSTKEQLPMRARIAGRVTPSLNGPQNGLEMIELPLNIKPTAIACCQSTGNLLVAIGDNLVLHEFKLETHSQSKLKFIDFEARPWGIGLHFFPTHLNIVEDFVSIMDSSRCVVFRLTNPIHEDIDQLSSLTSVTSSLNDKTSISTDISSMRSLENSCSLSTGDLKMIKWRKNSGKKDETDENSNLSATLNFTKKKNKNTCIDWNNLLGNEKKELNSLIDKGTVDQECQSFSMNLPSISSERFGSSMSPRPFRMDSADTEVFVKTISDDGWSENYEIKSVLQLKIVKEDDNDDIFTSLILKPLYLKNQKNIKMKKSIFRSEKYKYLNGITCLISTSQEGFIYHFDVQHDSFSSTCLTNYPFTAPVTHVTLENSILHAITEAGLESYTLRLSHYISKASSQFQSMELACPDISEPISLIGLRSFVDVQNLLNTDKFIILLTKAENSWTLYSLGLPTPEKNYNDILTSAENYKSSSPSVYRHLLEEAHAILRLEKDSSKWYNDDCNEIVNVTNLEPLYEESCALLGDYFINTEIETERRLCIPYYKMSKLKPSTVLSRKATQNAPGLVDYIINIILTVKSGPEADELFQSRDIVDIIKNESKENLFRIILESTVLREYATEKLIKLLEANEEDDFKRFALTLLYILAEKQIAAENTLDRTSNKFLFHVIVNYPQLLFDEDSYDSRNQATHFFSDFSATLICRKSLVFAQILAQLIEDEIISLHHTIQIFLEYLPSRVGRDGHATAAALEQFLEAYFQKYFSKVEDKSILSYDFAFIEAFKILIRCYLGKLLQSKVYNSNETLLSENWPDTSLYLFKNQRPKYLDKMPPIAKDYQKIICTLDLNEFSKTNNAKDDTVRIEILKLQAILASNSLPVECLREIEQFLDREDVDGSLAFRTLCNRDTIAVTTLLIEKCPQAVLQYAKDMFTKENEWKFLVESLQKEIVKHDSDQELRLFFEQTMLETLKHAAEVLPLQSLLSILPKNNDELEETYSEICGRIVHAEHVKSLLMETGNQLLSSLNL